MKNVSKLSTALSVTSSGASFASLYSVCHAACQGIITILALVGITLTGMPLAFLEQYTVPLVLFSTVMLTVSTIVLFQKRNADCHRSRRWKFLVALNILLFIVNIGILLLEFLA